MPTVAFIGTRDLGALPLTWVNLYTRAARRFAAAGYTVRTGGSSGAEQQATAACLDRSGRAEVVLPYAAFEQTWVGWAQQAYADRLKIEVYDRESQRAWDDAVRRRHPSGAHLSNASRAALARYYGVIAQAEVVVALPYARRGDPRDRGTTGHAIEWARGDKLTVFDLSKDPDRAALRVRLFEMEVQLAGRKEPDLSATPQNQELVG